MNDNIGFGPRPKGFHDPLDPKASSAAWDAKREREEAAEKARAEQIAEARSEAAKAAAMTKDRNPFMFDATPLKDADGNDDVDGLMIDAAVHSLLLSPHRRLDPKGYFAEQRRDHEQQRAQAIAEIREQAGDKREQAYEDELDRLERQTLNGEPINWDEIED